MVSFYNVTSRKPKLIWCQDPFEMNKVCDWDGLIGSNLHGSVGMFLEIRRLRNIQACGPIANIKKFILTPNLKKRLEVTWFGFQLLDRSSIWKTFPQHYCGDACPILERSDNSKYWSSNFNFSWDLGLRQVSVYWRRPGKRTRPVHTLREGAANASRNTLCKLIKNNTLQIIICLLSFPYFSCWWGLGGGAVNLRTPL